MKCVHRKTAALRFPPGWLALQRVKLFSSCLYTARISLKLLLLKLSRSGEQRPTGALVNVWGRRSIILASYGICARKRNWKAFPVSIDKPLPWPCSSRKPYKESDDAGGMKCRIYFQRHRVNEFKSLMVIEWNWSINLRPDFNKNFSHKKPMKVFYKN